MLGWRNARIRREAAGWIARVNGPGGESHRSGLHAWLAADPRHRAAYQRMEGIWGLAGQIKIDAPAAPVVHARPRHGLRLALAGAGALLLGIAVMLSLSGRAAFTEPESQILSLVTQTGQITEHELDDGSQVVLDTGSALDIRFDARGRRLTLRQGRARIRVSADPRPMVVSAIGEQARLGPGRFDVEAAPGRFTLAVLDGGAELMGEEGSPMRQLSAGDLISHGGGQPPYLVQDFAPTRWPEGMLDFDDVPLRDAVAAANRYSAIKIVLAGDDIAALRVTGAFRSSDPRAFARALASAFGLKAEERGGQILLRRRR